MDDYQEDGVERRVGVAVALEGIKGELKFISGRFDSLEKKQDACVEDRDALFKRIRQIDKAQSILDAKQKGVIKGIWIIGTGVVGVIVSVAGRVIYKSFHT